MMIDTIGIIGGGNYGRGSGDGGDGGEGEGERESSRCPGESRSKEQSKGVPAVGGALLRLKP